MYSQKKTEIFWAIVFILPAVLGFLLWNIIPIISSAVISFTEYRLIGPSIWVGWVGFKLATTHFNQGDVLIFGLYMMHASIPNRSNKYRISIDTRYQLAKEEKDERFFFGKDGTWLGNSYNKNIQYKSIEILRKEWGLNK